MVGKIVYSAGDIYVERGNLFQAKHTYKSIMDNYEGEDLVILATDKYQHVLNIEEQQNQAAEDFDNQDEDVEDEEMTIIKSGNLKYNVMKNI